MASSFKLLCSTVGERILIPVVEICTGSFGTHHVPQGKEEWDRRRERTVTSYVGLKFS